MAKLKPSQIASTSEQSQQIAFFCWAAYPQVREAFPELEWMHAIPNGAARGDVVVTRVIRGASLKAEGVKAGVLDTFLPVPNGKFYGLYIEFKKPGKDERAMTADQQRFAEFVRQQGYQWFCVNNWRHAAESVAHYLGVYDDNMELKDYSYLFEGM